MKTIAYILRNWFKQEPKYWLCVPEYVKSEKKKQQMIKAYTRFVNNKVKVISDKDLDN